jgi:hypothetical protein
MNAKYGSISRLLPKYISFPQEISTTLKNISVRKQKDIFCELLPK